MAILTLNSGSTSLKFGLYRNDGAAMWAEGEVKGIGSASGTFTLANETSAVTIPDAETALGTIVDRLNDRGLESVTAIGHRIVRGGPHLVTHQRLTGAVLKTMDDATHFAPLHLPAAVALVNAAEVRFPGVPEFACFDTAFHQTMPKLAYTYPLPLAYREAGLRRYGFHGLSFESVVRALGQEIPERIVVAHLGGGSSLCALLNGRSVDTTMGVSPAGGVVMGTRSGDLDPGVVLLLERRLPDRLPGLSVDDAEWLLNHESGLKALAGENDMKVLVERSDEDAEFAVDLYCREIVKLLAGLITVLNGLDSLIFTGGIGEHSETVRQKICAGLQGLNHFSVRVLKADEDGEIARHVAKLMDCNV